MPAVSTVCGYQCLALPPNQIPAFLVEHLASGRGGWVLTLNLEMVSRSARDPAYGALTRSADFIIADGMPIVWASKLKRGVPAIPGRAAGVDLSTELIRATDPARIAVIGGDNPKRALDALGIADAGEVYVFDGRVTADDATAGRLAAELRKRGSRVVFLALGVGKQDDLAALLRERIPEALLLGVGGTFELIGGQKKRAPKWMQRAGMEWLFRLMVEPQRLWKRYLVLYWSGAWLILRDLVRPIPAPPR